MGLTASPTVTEAATKLLDIADQLDATLKSNGADQNVATLAVTPAPAGG